MNSSRRRPIRSVPFFLNEYKQLACHFRTFRKPRKPAPCLTRMARTQKYLNTGGDGVWLPKDLLERAIAEVNAELSKDGPKIDLFRIVFFRATTSTGKEYPNVYSPAGKENHDRHKLHHPLSSPTIGGKLPQSAGFRKFAQFKG